MTDGGRRWTADIAPAESADLVRFLDDHAEAPAFELTYEVEGAKRTRMLADASLIDRTLARPGATTAIRCVPIPPDADPFSVRADAVVKLAVINPPAEEFTATATTLAEQATAYKRLAGANSGAVDVTKVLMLLHRTDGDVHRDALRALRLVAADRPTDCTTAFPLLQSLVESDDHELRADALRISRAIGQQEPTVVLRLIDEISPSLHSENGIVRREAVRCIAAIADANPTAAIAAVPGLATVLDDESDGLPHAVYTLSCITRVYPAAVTPIAASLATTLADDSHSTAVRLNATAALLRIVDNRPDIGGEVVDDVVLLLNVDHRRLRASAVALLDDVAATHPDVIESHTESILALVDDPDTNTRIHASTTLVNLAVNFPERLDQATSMVVEILSDDHPFVRENACLVLGHLGVRDARSALEDRAHKDGNGDVRSRAEWALDEIDS